MVSSEIRREKRTGGRGTFREIIARGNREGTVGASERAEESPRIRDNNTIVHVYATQRTEYHCILYGDYCQEGDDCVDRALVRGDHR